MTTLRQQMIDAMQQRGFSDRTHKTYLAAVSALARHYHTPPDQIGVDQIQEYFVYLVKQKNLSGASCRLYLNALRFLYLQVLKWDHFDVPIQYPKRAERIPELLTRAEALASIAAMNLKKSPGGHTTVVSSFWQAVTEDAPFLRKQFSLYSADLASVAVPSYRRRSTLS